MPQSLAQIYLHIIFSTKHRQPFLSDRNVREAMHAYLGGNCNGLNCAVLRVGGVADHVHIACSLGRTISVADLIKEIKRASSQWAKQYSPSLADFHWQSGYGVFSISPKHVDALVAYIDNQEEHHRAETFQDEFRRILRAYGIEWDEKFVWD